MPNCYLSEKKKRDVAIKKLINKYMALREMNQTDVANRMGKTQQWFSYNLQNASFTISEIVGISLVLKIDWAELGNILNS